MTSNGTASWHATGPRDWSTIPGLILLPPARRVTGLHPQAPPGHPAATAASRIHHFAASLGHVDGVDLVVGITHSPVLRAVASHFAGTDPGEPDYLHGHSVQLSSDGALALHSVDWKQADRA